MNRLRLIIVLALVVVLSCLFIVIFRAGEPRYQGRTLTEWIKIGQIGDLHYTVAHGGENVHLETDPLWQQTSHALKQMAPDAIPILLKWTQAKDSMFKKEIVKWSNQLRFFNFHIKRAVEYRSMAVVGFRLLGDDARPAWPALTRLTADKDSGIRNWAVQCLAASMHDKDALMKILARGIKDPDPGVQYTAKWWFHNLYPTDAEAAGIYKPVPPFTSSTRIGGNTTRATGR